MEIVKEAKELIPFDTVSVGACFARETGEIYVRITSIVTDANSRINAVNLDTGYPVYIVPTTKVVPMYDMVLAHRSRLK